MALRASAGLEYSGCGMDSKNAWCLLQITLTPVNAKKMERCRGLARG